MPRKLANHELGRLSVDAFRKAGKRKIVLVLDNIRSLHNVGSAFRTADAFRVEQIVLCGVTGVPPHREIEKTALGATQTVEWKHFATTTDALSSLRAAGYRIFAVEQTESSIPLQEFSAGIDEKLALVFGNEVYGVDQKVVQSSDGVVEIPQWGTKHSLNVAVSIGIVLWEIARTNGE